MFWIEAGAILGEANCGGAEAGGGPTDDGFEPCRYSTSAWGAGYSCSESGQRLLVRNSAMTPSSLYTQQSSYEGVNILAGFVQRY